MWLDRLRETKKNLSGPNSIGDLLLHFFEGAGHDFESRRCRSSSSSETRHVVYVG